MPDAEQVEMIRKYTAASDNRIRFELFATRVAATHFAAGVTFDPQTAQVVLHHFSHVLLHLAEKAGRSPKQGPISKELAAAKAKWGAAVDGLLDQLRAESPAYHTTLVTNGASAFGVTGLETRVDEYSQLLALGGTKEAAGAFATNCGAKHEPIVILIGASVLGICVTHYRKVMKGFRVVPS